MLELIRYTVRSTEQMNRDIIIIINIIIYLTAHGVSPSGSGYNACTYMNMK